MGATGLILVFPRARGFVRSVWGVETLGLRFCEFEMFA